MISTAIIALLSASAAFAAPTGSASSDSPIVARSCGPANLFKNPAFNAPGTEWALTGESGTGTVKGGVQNTYFPVNWPSNGGPSAYALNFTIPASQSKSVSLQQAIPITDGDNYEISYNIFLSGTTTAKCTAINYAGVGNAFPTLLRLPPVSSSPPAGNFYVNRFTVPGNNWQNMASNNIAGAQFTCTAGSTDAAVTIYLDNASIIDKC